MKCNAACWYCGTSSEHPPDVPGIRITCVEGDVPIYSRIVRLLQAHPLPYSVALYNSGYKAISALPMTEPHVVFISDVLCDMPGVSCTRRLKQLAPGMHVVMHGDRQHSNNILLALAVGASAYLVRPLSDSELILALLKSAERTPFLCEKAQAIIIIALQEAFRRCGATPLSYREQEVMTSLLSNAPVKEIATSLNIAPNTARVHVARVLKKLGVHNRRDIVRMYLGS